MARSHVSSAQRELDRSSLPKEPLQMGRGAAKVTASMAAASASCKSRDRHAAFSPRERGSGARSEVLLQGLMALTGDASLGFTNSCAGECAGDAGEGIAEERDRSDHHLCSTARIKPAESSLAKLARLAARPSTSGEEGCSSASFSPGLGKAKIRQAMRSLSSGGRRSSHEASPKALLLAWRVSLVAPSSACATATLHRQA